MFLFSSLEAAMNTLQPKRTNSPRGAGMSSLQDAARLLSIYLTVPIYVGSRRELSLHAFLSQAVFSEALQPCYRAEYLKSLLRLEEQRSAYVLEDPLGTRAILILADDNAVLIGPFVPSAYQEKRAHALLSGSVRPDSALMLRFKVYWCGLALCDVDSMARALSSLLAFAGYVLGDFTVHHVSLAAEQPRKASAAAAGSGSQTASNPQAASDPLAKIEERYALEARLMQEIASGRTDEAIAALHRMLRQSRPQEGMTLDLWPQDSAMAIMRTIIRLSAVRSGLPAPIIDAISLDYAQQMRKLGGDPKRMTRLYERMITDLCREIRLMREEGYSPLTMRALHLISRGFSQPLSIGEVAAELQVSESTLTRSLKKDTGHSFTELLREVRLREAAAALSTTSAPVQQIAAGVGIDDSNYFVKIFRKEYTVTPTAYRRSCRSGRG